MEWSGSTELLRMVFGSIVERSTSAVATEPAGAVAEMFGVYNAAVLFILAPMLWVVFTIDSVSAGASGKLLQARYANPKRLLIGTLACVCMMPFFGGFSVAQVLVMGSMKAGSELADNMATAAQEHGVSAGLTIPLRPDRGRLAVFAQELYTLETCRQVSNATGEPVVGDWDHASKTRIEYSYSTASSRAQGTPDGRCGRFVLELEDLTLADRLADTDALQAAQAAALQAHFNALSGMVERLPEYVDPGLLEGANQKAPMFQDQAAYAETLKALVLIYEHQLLASFKQALDVLKVPKDGAPRSLLGEMFGGWVDEGFRFAEINRNASFVRGLALALPTVERPALHDMSAPTAVAVRAANALVVYEDLARGHERDGSLYHGLFESPMVAMGQAVRDTVAGAVFDDDLDPLTNIQQIGHQLIVGGSTLWMTTKALELKINVARAEEEDNDKLMDRLSQSAPFGLGAVLAVGQKVFDALASAISGPGAERFLAWVSPIFNIALLLIACGAIMAYWIPAIPFMIWLFAVLGWLGMVAQALVGSVIWCAAHAMPEGESISGDRVQQGWIRMIMIMLRPAMLLLSLYLALFILHALPPFLQLYFAFFDTMNEGFTVVVGQLAALLALTVIMVVVVSRVMQLVYEIPDQVPRWIGGGETETGGEAQHQDSSKLTAGYFQHTSIDRTGEGSQKLNKLNDQFGPKV